MESQSYEVARTSSRTECQQSQDEVKTLLQQLAEMDQPGVDLEEMTSKKERLKYLLDIPQDRWIEKSKFPQSQGRYASFTSDVNKLASNTGEITPMQVLATASGGLALKGIMVGHTMEPKQIVLGEPRTVTFMSPSIKQLNDLQEFSSKVQLNEFVEVLDTMGYSFAADKWGDRCRLNRETDQLHNQESKQATDIAAPNQYTYHSQVIYDIVPMAACQLNSRDLKLSPHAILELQAIANCIKQAKETEHVEGLCEAFLNTYGSHVNAGLLHFGGIHKFIATHAGETQSKSETIRAMVRNALTVFASMNYSGFGVGVGGSVSAHHLKSCATMAYDNSDLSRNILHTNVTGGPQSVVALPLWKLGLLACNSSWALIDRGNLLTDVVCIWDLIPNHDDFTEPQSLATSLKSVWEKINKTQKLKCVFQTDKVLCKLARLESKVEAWASEPKFSRTCVGHLQNLLQAVEEVEVETGTQQHWANALFNRKVFSAFFAKVVDSKKHFDNEDTPMIQYILKKLVSHSGRVDFVGKDSVLEWLGLPTETHDMPIVMTRETIRDMSMLLNVSRENLLSDRLPQVSENCDARATVEVDLGINILSQSITSRHELFFLKIFLLELDYDWARMQFRGVFTTNTLDRVLSEIAIEWQTFQNLRDDVQIEAFLIHLLLNSTRFQADQQLREVEFNSTIKRFRQAFTPQISRLLDVNAQSSSFDWDEIMDITGQVAKGNMFYLMEKGLDLSGLKDVLMPCLSDDGESCHETTGTYPMVVSNVYADLISKLGLTQYYPNGITMQQATAIKPIPVEVEPAHLPWKLMHMLLMIDHRIRDSVLTDLKASKQNDNSDQDISLLDFGDLDDGDDILSPIDILLATFTSCNGILRQALAHKLFVCKLAIPFFYPVGSPNNLVMSLWALRTITVEWHEREKPFETSVTDRPFPVISFARLGRPLISKSKLINSVLRDEPHNTFFNHECLNSAGKRHLADGLVECSWFLPAKKESNIFRDVVLFLNLRGDCCSNKKQMNTLNKSSSMVVIAVNIEDLVERPQIDTFAEICKAAKHVIVLLTSTSSIQMMKAVLQTNWLKCIEHIGKEHFKRVKLIHPFRKGALINVGDLTMTVRDTVSALIDRCSRISIEEIAAIAEKEGILHDEHQACLRGKQFAKKLVKHIEGNGSADCKRNMLNLQSKTWMEYSSLFRNQQKHSQAHPPQQYQAKKDTLRQEQVRACNNLTKLCQQFLKYLIGIDNEDERLYFLHWVKLLLDAKSREKLPKLQSIYRLKWTEFQKANRNKVEDSQTDLAKIEALREAVDQAEVNLVNASFGLNNLFRELGLIYEIAKGSKLVVETEFMKRIEYLPEIVANLLVNGIPLELVDGDVSNIALTWIEAVLSKLQEVLKGKKLFIISVLGIQSSGKSTLLNTMFGLQFTVSAGRCTRGAFMQVIPIGQPESPDSYIAVIDTEGVRAPELGGQNHNHDNELATLAIGLGDVTVMNIKGENPSDMKDILQIAVHAFMRMRVVNKHLHTHQSCVFTHQNVPADNAADAMMHSRYRFQETLDLMTKEAAAEENISDIQMFSQMIKFDIDSNVWYFSDLWKGDPPMAHANPGYSKEVQNVVLCLLNKAVKDHNMLLTVSDFSTRVRDLWKAILADDFVFSFHNSLEIKAYNELETLYHELEWKLEMGVMKWIQQKAEILLKNCETVKCLEACMDLMTTELATTISEKAESIKARLEEYFEKSDLRRIVIQWETTRYRALELCVVERNLEGKRHMLAIKEARLIEIIHRENQGKHENHILDNAVGLAIKLEGKEAADSEMKINFDEMWKPMVNEMSSNTASQGINIKVLMETILWGRFQGYGYILQKEWINLSHSKDILLGFLHKSITLEYIKESDLSLMKHLEGNTTLKQPQNDPPESNEALLAMHISLQDIDVHLEPLRDQEKKGTVKQNEPQSDSPEVTKAFLVTQSALQDIDVHLEKLNGQDIKFQRSHATEVIEMLISKFDNYNKNESNEFQFTILPRFVVKLAVHITGHCVEVFSKMQTDYDNMHGIEAKLEAFKQTAWNVFKNTVKQSTEEVIAADLFCDQLKEIVHKAVMTAIPNEVVTYIIDDFSATKHYFIVRMMEDLAMKDNFDSCSLYINNASAFAYKWIKEYTDNKLFSIKSDNTQSWYAELALLHIQKIHKHIEKGVQHATRAVLDMGDNRMEVWIDTFCKVVEEQLPVPRSSLRRMTSRQITDFDNLRRIILEKLNTVEVDLISVFGEHNEKTIKWEGLSPSERVSEKLWGCKEQCPFCSEPCYKTTPNHYDRDGQSHHCIQHRPTGIRGYRWKSDDTIGGVTFHKDELITETCNHWIVSTDMTFMCKGCSKCPGGIFHHYREYNQFYPEWYVAPDSSNAVPKYWMWFMAKYQVELGEMHGTLPPTIPPQWLSIKREDALEDLLKEHN